MALIRYVAESQGVFSVQSVSKALSLPPSTVHRLLDKLRSQDLVTYNQSAHRYGIGPELYRIGQIVATHPITSLADPILEEITRSTGEASIFCVLLESQSKLIFARMKDSNHKLRYNVVLNQPQTLVLGASGHSILAYLPDAQIETCAHEEFARKKDAADRTSTLRSHLEEVRKRGYAMTFGQRIGGAVGIAVPVFGVRDMIIGSICLTIPAPRYNPRDLRRVLGILCSKGKQLSETMGARREFLETEIPSYGVQRRSSGPARSGSTKSR